MCVVNEQAREGLVPDIDVYAAAWSVPGPLIGPKRLDADQVSSFYEGEMDGGKDSNVDYLCKKVI